MSEVGSHEWIMARAEELIAAGETEPRLARDPVNQPQIHTWLEAIGDANPVYRDTPEATEIHGGAVAPPAMAQVWTMYGLGLPGEDGPDRSADPLHVMMGVMDEAGYTSVLGTNSDQTYDRYLRPGEQVSVTTSLDSVVGPKRTGVGEGYFVTSRSVWRVGDEQVATMSFRVLKFKPGTGRPTVDRTKTVRPVKNRDTEFFWQGMAEGELRLQKCNTCGALRHPPGPMCPQCHGSDQRYVVSPGRGTVYSYTVHHAPQIPGKQLPLLIAVVELEEGVRMTAELRGVAHEHVRVGMPVHIGFDRIDDDLTLPVFEAVGEDD